MKALVAGLIVLLVFLQYKLWLGEGSLNEIWQLHQAIDAQTRENAALKERNAALDAEVKDLKHGLDAIEERARAELGMIKKDETFYRIVE
ncbi:MAG: cell division protein FtsB [Gammaproteobacteria bacterium]|jgi:cell division protein FtsB|nr:cell division protein FtsB [Gammaproteobacteria bacterium]